MPGDGMNAGVQFRSQRIPGDHEVIGKNPRLLKSGHQSVDYYVAMWSTLLAGKPWNAEFRNRRKDGSLYESMAVISPIIGAAGGITGYVAVSRDVTAERHSEHRSQQLARERSLLAQTLRQMDATASAEANSAAISRQLLTMGGVATAGLFMFTPDGSAQPYGFAVAGDGQPLFRIPKRRAAYLKARSASGPWIAAWENLPGHPYNDLFMSLGVRSIAYAPVRSADRLIGFSSEMAELNHELKVFLRKALYQHYQVLRATLKARRVVQELFHIFMDDPRLLPPQFFRRSEDNIPRAIADYIAGMTDRYAMKEHQRLTVPGVQT